MKKLDHLLWIELIVSLYEIRGGLDGLAGRIKMARDGPNIDFPLSNASRQRLRVRGYKFWNSADTTYDPLIVYTPQIEWPLD